MAKVKVVAAAILAALSLSTAAAAQRAPSEQVQILAETADSGEQGGWFVTPEASGQWNRWFYAVTDLDRDGRLEIFKAKAGDEDGAPELRCEELNDQGGGRSWGLYFAGGTDVPDILTGESAAAPVVIYEQGNNKYHYIFQCSAASDGEEWDYADTKYALTLAGDLIVEELAVMRLKLPAPGSDLAMRRFFLPGWHGVETESGETGIPEEISAERYADIELERFGAEIRHDATIKWYRAEELQPLIGQAGLSRALESSCKAFLDGGQYY